MKAETYRDLIEWTQQLHGQLASRLEAGAADSQTGERMSALLRYLAEHERRMQQMVLRFEQQADIKVLDSWVYDHFTDNPRMRTLNAGQSFAGLDHDALCALACAPAMLLAGLVAGLIGPGPALIVTNGLTGIGFLVIWGAGMVALARKA